MELLKEFVRIMQSCSTKEFKTVFDDDSSLFDHCPSEHPYRIYGREAIEMFFNNKFFFGTFKVLEVIKITENNISFVASYVGVKKAAIANVIKTADGRKIRRVIVRPL